MNQLRQIVNDALAELLAERTEIDSRLKEAIKYTLDAPGKRVRGSVVLLACELVSGEMNRSAKTAAAAIEMVDIDHILPLNKIGSFLKDINMKGGR